MRSDNLTVVDGATAGAWIEPRLDGEFGSVARQVPKGYEAYARILHPAHDSKGEPVRWAQVAAACGTTVHPEMQWNALTGAFDPCVGPGAKWQGSPPMTGWMDLDELDALCEILATRPNDPSHCYFGLSTIMSWEEDFSSDEMKPFLDLPLNRSHIVLAGPLSAVDQIARDHSKPSRREAPNLIWPADRTWFVASEVDFDSTLVGASTKLVQAIVNSSAMEAWAVEPTTSLACDADTINAPSR